jgi:hypothetical protein
MVIFEKWSPQVGVTGIKKNKGIKRGFRLK